MNPIETTAIPLCNSADLVDSGEAVPFDVVYCGRTMRGFAIRFGGTVYGYLNQCAHVPMEMDYQENRFFDDSGRWTTRPTDSLTARAST